MNSIKLCLQFAFIGLLLVSCSNEPSEPKSDIRQDSWTEIEKKAEGSTVTFMMWQGSPVLNDYINNYLVPTLKEKYNIRLEISGGHGPEIVKLIMDEKQANVRNGQVDMVWINGETFFQLRKISGLWGPFVEKLPSSEYVNFDNKFISIDFQQPIEYMEAPWGMGQFALVYDSAKTTAPPRNLSELETFVKANPGSFTISNDFSGMTVLKCFMAELGGSPNSLDGAFDQPKYDRLSKELWDLINRNKRYFWKKGTNFPKEHTKMDQMFATGELVLIYGFSEGGVESKIEQGLYPKSTRAYVWDNGTVLNSNFLGIPYNSGNKAGAMVAINFMMSPEGQYNRQVRSGRESQTILDMDLLPEEWRQKFDSAPKRKYSPDPAVMAENAIQEPAAEYMINLFEDFRTEVIEK